MSPAEKALAAILGVILTLVLVGCCVWCIRKTRKRTTAGIGQTSSPAQTLSTQEPTQMQTLTIAQCSPQQLPQPQYQYQNYQPSMIPLHQPSETPASLSSFTRISSTAPEVVAVLSSAHAASTRSSTTSTTMAGFSLARLLGKSNAGSSSKGAGTGIYHYHHRHRDRDRDCSLQKTPSLTPSTGSSSYDHYWNPSSTGKEHMKDGLFPAITLTSPTNSEASIPLCLQDDAPAISIHGTDPHHDPSASKGSSSSASTFQQCVNTMNISDTSAGSSMSLQPLPRATEQLQPLYMLQQSVPQHLLLHPSFAYNRGLRFEKQADVLPSQTSHSITDFPPTYEEAIDGAGPSKMTLAPTGPATSDQVSSEPGSSALPQRTLHVPSLTLSESVADAPLVDPPFASSLPFHRADVPFYDDTPTRADRNADQAVWDPDGDMNPDADNDPLVSLSLRPVASIRVQADTDG